MPAQNILTFKTFIQIFQIGTKYSPQTLFLHNVAFAGIGSGSAQFMTQC